ncbi:hypothetical protein BSZ40_05635 [Buchananella hordeovulneris]|uniref:NTP pyrophosphohydrolase n=1 Tax=Buchananella hordeovulneris TaxID=52770 RepID=A0A1Q5PVP0_9ACTO|nr:hypothetical protein BSZ40_05635 [Buchananella hordeovulneris]
MLTYECVIYSPQGIDECFEWWPHDPSRFADEIESLLRDPGFVDGHECVALKVWRAPEGQFPSDFPARAIVKETYLRCRGAHQAMIVESRVTRPDRTFDHYIASRMPVADPAAWESVTWLGKDGDICSVDVHPEEVFTGEQAVPIFRAYIEQQEFPSRVQWRRVGD